MVAAAMTATFALFQTCLNSFTAMFFHSFCKPIATTSFPRNSSFQSYTYVYDLSTQLFKIKQNLQTIMKMQ